MHLFHLAAEAENRPKSAHRYNVAEQQQVYKSEIERIWKAQHDSLSRKDEPPLDVVEDEKIFKKPLPPQRQGSVSGDYVMSPGFSPGFSPPGTGPSAMPSPALSRGSSVDRDRETSLGPDGPRRVLRIRRLVSDCFLRVGLGPNPLIF
jgi:transcription initiation factor TFIID subunit 1